LLNLKFQLDKFKNNKEKEIIVLCNFGSIFLKVIIYLFEISISFSVKFEKAKINNLFLVKKKSPNKQSGIVIGHRLVDDTYLFDILEL
jgi:hypothetical protein